MRRFHGIRLLADAALLAAAAGEARAVDWEALAAPGVVEIVTEDEDGSRRETKIWIVSLDDGRAYVRTKATTWFGNLERDPNALLRSGEAEIPVRVEPVTDAALAARVEAALREKYGFTDWVRGVFLSFGDTNVMRLAAR